MNIEEINGLERFSANPKQGVYFLFNGDKLVYIGQSSDIHSRLNQHRLGDKVFDSYSFIIIEDIKERLDKEHFLIMKHNPVYNMTISGKKLQTLKQFCFEYNVDCETIVSVLNKDGVKPAKNIRNSLNSRYHVKDLAPYVNHSRNQAKMDNHSSYVDRIKAIDRGRNILVHYKDAKRLMKGETFNKAMFVAIMKVTTAYQKGKTLAHAIAVIDTSEIIEEDLIRILNKEEGYLENKRKLYEEVKDELDMNAMQE